MDIKPNWIFFSYKTKTSFRILELNINKIKVIELTYGSVEQEYELEKFNDALKADIITFEKHKYQNTIIDGMRDNKDIKEEYAKNKHWGGTR